MVLTETWSPRRRCGAVHEEIVTKTHHIHFAVLRKTQMKVRILKEMHRNYADLDEMWLDHITLPQCNQVASKLGMATSQP
jgi:hypothetical protein